MSFSPLVTLREPVSKSWNEMYGCVPLPFNAPMANVVAGLCIVSLRMVPKGKPFAGSNVCGTSAIGSGLVAMSLFALAMLVLMSAIDASGPFTPITNTMSFAMGPASAVMELMTSLIWPSWLWLTIMLTTKDGRLSASTLSLSLAR